MRMSHTGLAWKHPGLSEKRQALSSMQAKYVPAAAHTSGLAGLPTNLDFIPEKNEIQLKLWIP